MINLSGIRKQYGSQILFDNANLQLNVGEKVGLVGPNGAGKSTIFRLFMGEEAPDSGSVSIPDRVVVGYFSQTIGDMKGRSALEEVVQDAGLISKLAVELKKIEQQLEDCAITPLDDLSMTKLLERYSEVQADFQHRGGYELESRAQAILTGLGIGPEDFNRPVESFSGGWKMRIALAKLLALNPDVLLMDEPTNYLDVESIEWLEEWIKAFKGALLMTSHDREFMNRIITRIVEVAQRTTSSYSGNYDFFEKESAIRKEQLISSHKKQQDMLAKEEEFIARFAARASHAAQVQSRVKKLEKIDRIEIPPEERSISFQFAEAPRSGNDVVVMTSLGKTWPRDGGAPKKVFSGVSGVVRRLDKIAVTGVNGAGKSTLLKIITGQTNATEGTVTLGSNVKIGYFSQLSLEVLNASSTIYEEIYSRVPDASIGFVRSLCGAFLFSGDDVHKKISVLSGGEKSRVLLASLLANPVNFLILDEPTNHLDILSRQVLLKAIQDYQGTVMMVSHDRHFVRSIANRVFEVDHGLMNIFEGDYDYYRSKSAHYSHLS